MNKRRKKPQEPPNAMRSLRYAHKPALTQADLAARIGGSTQADISSYERGDSAPSIQKAADIVNALGAPFHVVFYGYCERSFVRSERRGKKTTSSTST